MNDYDLMKLAQRCDEDAPDPDEEEIMAAHINSDSPQEFKRRYKEFYSDIKETLIKYE